MSNSIHRQKQNPAHSMWHLTDLCSSLKWTVYCLNYRIDFCFNCRLIFNLYRDPYLFRYIFLHMSFYKGEIAFFTALTLIYQVNIHPPFVSSSTISVHHMENRAYFIQCFMQQQITSLCTAWQGLNWPEIGMLEYFMHLLPHMSWALQSLNSARMSYVLYLDMLVVNALFFNHVYAVECLCFVFFFCFFVL